MFLFLTSFVIWILFAEAFLLITLAWWELMGWSTAVLVLMIATAGYLGGPEVRDTISTVPWWGWVVGVLGYALIGIIWSLFKWTRYVSKAHTQFVEKKKTWMADQRNINIKGSWEQNVKDNDLIPNANNQKSKIAFWISYWPISIFWAILQDLLREIGEWIYERINSLYHKITRSYFKEEMDSDV